MKGAVPEGHSAAEVVDELAVRILIELEILVRDGEGVARLRSDLVPGTGSRPSL